MTRGCPTKYSKNDIFSIIPKPDSIKLVKEDVFQPFHRPKTPIYIVNTKKEVRCSTPNPKPKKRIRNLTKDSKDLNENEISQAQQAKIEAKLVKLRELEIANKAAMEKILSEADRSLEIFSEECRQRYEATDQRNQAMQSIMEQRKQKKDIEKTLKTQ